jgi:hypothetical protein
MIEGPAGLKANAHKALTQELVKTFPNFELKVCLLLSFTISFLAKQETSRD